MEERRRKFDTESEVPTAVLISFDDEPPPVRGTNGGVAGERRGSVERNRDPGRSGPRQPSRSATTDPPTAQLPDAEGADRSPVGAARTDGAAPVVDGDDAIPKAGLVASQVDKEKRCTMEEVKLCGYLNKMGEKGLIKAYKTRWFVFDKQRCRLYYYRTPQDLLPLGSIDIANAMFNFEANDSTSTGQFHISTGGRIYHLQAKDRHTMMFWLQELQERRRAYSHQRTSLQRDKSLGHVSPTSVQPNSGLVCTQKIKDRSGDPFRGLPPLLGPVEVPKHSVGESTAYTTHQTGVFNLSLTNLKTEIRNQMSNLGIRRTNSDEASLVNLAAEPSQSEPTSATKRPTTLSTAPSSGNQEPGQAESVPPTEGVKAAKGSIKAGFIKKFTRTSNADIPSPTAVWFENQPSQNYECAQCRKLHSALTAVQEELEYADQEALNSREVITMLHKQLTATQMEHSTNDVFLQSKTDQEKLLILRRKDKQLIQLEQLLQEMREAQDNVLDQLRTKEHEADQAKEQNSMFMEMIAAKDQVVMSLTVKLHDLEQKEPIMLTTTPQGTIQSRPVDRPQGRSSSFVAEQLAEVPSVDQAEFDKLKDVYQAFETQNKFLNTEILELNKIREDDQLRESILFERYSEMEAEFYRTQSKYLLLLDQMKTPKRGSNYAVAESDDELISRLIEEAIETDTADVQRPTNKTVDNGGYDRYGFKQQLEQSGEEAGALASKAAMAKRRSEEIESLRSNRGISVSIKWENYLVQHGHGDLTKTLELKSLVRQGIPHEYRHRVWKAMVEWRVKRDKELTGPGYYDKLLKSEKFKMNPATKQIELDLLRTLPTNKNFDNIESQGIPCLRRVLKAYSVHNPAIGYCQGLNRVAAISLLFLDEEDAFWCLIAIVECIMPAEYYSTTLIGSQTDQRVFKDLLAEKLPKLNTHLDNFGIDLSLISFNWFITVFCDNVPPETMVRIWDTFLYEGNKVLFRFALAFLKRCETELLALQDYILIFHYLRKMTSQMTDIHRLSEIAFNELNPFPRRHINAKRAFHRTHIKQQLEELNQMRDEYVPKHKQSAEGVISDDEEDYDTVEALSGKS